MPAQADYIGIGRAFNGFRLTKADGALPASATSGQDTFTIAHGRILVIGLVSQVGTVIQTQACNTKWIAKPTGGTAEDLCAVKDISALEAGTLRRHSHRFAFAGRCSSQARSGFIRPRRTPAR